ncbi:hypothetical protein QIS74_04993 [Colletotrichum tabaci]|uniref:Uncharacterized protein n=1 Tax=Colletotrichum tabaci TaxID=1209068 RepID=A0AAV9TGS6_9PEZI
MNSGGRRPRGHEGQGTATACPRRAAAGRGLEGPRRRFGAAKSRLDDASTLERILRTAVTAKCVSATPGTLEGTWPRPEACKAERGTLERESSSAPGTLEGSPKYPGKGMSGALERQSTLERRFKVPWKGSPRVPRVPWSRNPKYPGKQFPSTLESKF